VRTEPLGSDELWVVVVSYGTKPGMPYATVPNETAAKSLAGLAEGLGFKSPRVMTQKDYFGRKGGKNAPGGVPNPPGVLPPQAGESLSQS